MVKAYNSKVTLLYITLLIVVSILACTNIEPTATPIITTVEIEKIVDVEKSTGNLIIYSGRSESLISPIIKQFSEASGINVKVKYAKSSQLASLLLEEANKTPADVFFAQDPGALGAVEDNMQNLPDSIMSLVPKWAKSTNNKWIGISGRARTVVYNTAKLEASELPDDMWGFTDPKWNGKIGWAPTNASFQTMVTAMRSSWGEEKTEEWLNGIQSNNPKLYPKNTPQVAAAAIGEIDVGFVNHYYLHRFTSTEGSGFAARNYHPRAGGPGSVIMVAGAGILNTAENRSNAEKFLRFMLSPIAQQYFSSKTFEYPVIDGVEHSVVLVPLEDINPPNIPLSDMADLAGTIALLQKTGILP
jgi:iron(III) transport system substrate-binding protein